MVNKIHFSNFPRAQDIFKLLVLSDHQSKTQQYLLYNYITKTKAANFHI